MEIAVVQGVLVIFNRSFITLKIITGLSLFLGLLPLLGQSIPQSNYFSVSIQGIEAKQQEYPGSIKHRFKAWKQLIIRYSDRSTADKLKATNDFFNKFSFKSKDNYQGTADYWKTPDELIIDGGGNCGDFSIAKYFTLLALGVPMQQLHITYVKSIDLNHAHMVLAYYPKPDSEPLLLDNLRDGILAASKRLDLVPVYSFSGEELWLAKLRSKDKLQGNSNRLSKWKNLMQRMKKKDYNA